MDDLMLVYQPDGPFFSGSVLYGDSANGERGAIALSTFEKVTFALMLCRLAEQVSLFVEKEEKIGVTVRRTDLRQSAHRFDEETILLLHADPVSVIRSLSPAPTKVLVRRADPATTSPLRIGYDVIAVTFGDELYTRRRGDQLECVFCGRWADVISRPLDDNTAKCRSMSCGAFYGVALKSERWASVRTSLLLGCNETEKFFFPREWNKPGPWVTREELEKKHRDWIKIKEEFA